MKGGTKGCMNRCRIPIMTSQLMIADRVNVRKAFGKNLSMGKADQCGYCGCSVSTFLKFLSSRVYKHDGPHSGALLSLCSIPPLHL